MDGDEVVAEGVFEPNVLLDVPDIFEVEALPVPAEEAAAFPKALIMVEDKSHLFV